MAFVLAVLGGAAAVEISKLLHKDKHSPKDLEDLEEKEHELRLLVKELEEELQDERKAHQVNSKRVQELSATAEQLEHVKSELEQESATLRTDKAQLLQRTETLVQQQAELRQTSEGLRVENTSLTQQVNRLKIVNQEAVSTFADHLKRLKVRVVGSFEQFSQGFLDSHGLLDTLKDLGMEVNFSAESLDALPDVAGRPGLKDTEPLEEQMRADFSKQLRLISDSPERLGMLLASVAGQDVIVDVDEPSTSSVPSLTFPTLKSPPKERKSSSVFNFLSALSLTPRGQEENTQQRVPALNLSSVGRELPTMSPSRALQPAEFDSNSGTALVFKQPKKESKKGSKYTLNLAPGASERTTPRKAAPRTPKKSQSAVPALDFHGSENTEPFSASQELVSRRSLVQRGQL
ncbi:hypothetical protein WJX82_004917 [Trebouxia sp. C0006]